MEFYIGAVLIAGGLIILIMAFYKDRTNVLKEGFTEISEQLEYKRKQEEIRKILYNNVENSTTIKNIKNILIN